MDKESKSHKQKPLIGITMGDINGIGPEVIIKALANNKMTQYFTPIIYGSAKVLSFYRKQLNLDNFNFSPINDLSKPYHRKVNVINCWEDTVEVTPGQDNSTGGECAFQALETATNDLKEGRIDALITAPINKLNIQNDNFKFAGHTEYLAEKAGTKESLMFMVSDAMRVGVLTGHIPLKDVAAQVTKENIIKKVKMMTKSLKQDFGIAKPKIAVLGLNPHAGEDGLLGSEEIDIIRPAIEEFKSKGQIVMGPYPADGFFGSGEHHKFDAVLAMYHDQGLIPFKSLTFSTGVNFTAGLPFVRTSPDHGTAYALAGRNQADEGSMRTAIFAALDIANCRLENKEA
ncbi:4-hydroxythreonine-4-phosphate dehydrogenase PdxA [Reichenbachiella carrageenanivorans]|uniref:4-hydroxythreonine-4-phosphate dehydrogenase PdxA n=1 Tax=Reichenbachiella carrageenanivorans TaxID=2979869 RepID=A0ABY6CZ38_9BACT|nr:4-hydroxythreonine-4-phosphate dehydrogenase PdxA [Reichenbachiella carrageenanivorans]UXX79181.1 4-hydroxythreonine-4-phosphate dehydrogenase PdxA [Reichenbachiella carrageenanivorans]